MNLDDVKRWRDADGGILIRVDWFDSDGRVSRIGDDSLATEIAIVDHAVGWFFADGEELRPHAFRFDAVSRLGDEVTLTQRGALYQVVLSPLWLAEQRAQMKDFRARVIIADDLKLELGEMVRQADR